jgi:ankyrin repeat protein
MAIPGMSNATLDLGSSADSNLHAQECNGASDKTDIPVASLLRVLGGVAAATKAPNASVQPLAEWISQHGARCCANTPQAFTQLHCGIVNDAKSVPGAAPSVEAWLAGIASGPAAHDEGLRQLAELTLGVAILREKSRRGMDFTTVDLDVIWSLIHDALICVQGARLQCTASRSAQGFLGVPLCSLLQEGRIDELFRLHVWLPDGERGMAEVAIHSHQPFAQSWILAGYGTDYMYKVEGTDDPFLATHAEYVPRWSDGKQAGAAYKTHQTSSTVTNTGKLVRVTPIGSEMHTRDMSYSIPGGAYHQTAVPSGRFHATLFFFDSHRGFLKDAGVVGPKDGQGYTQLRDPAGITPLALAQMVDATRSWEKSKRIQSEGNDEHTTVIGYYRYFHGCALLQAGQREDAMKQFNSPEGCTPAQAFCKEPSDEHRRYIRALIEAGADLDIVDDQGYKALDYAVSNGDAVTEALILDGLRRQLGGDVESKISRHRYEATIRKEYRDLFEERLRPILRSRRKDSLEQMRHVYANALATDEAKRRMFDRLRYVWYSDFCKSGRLPRYSDGTVKTFSAGPDRDSPSNNADYIIFFSYRWIHKDPTTGKTAPDDKVHTQYRRMLRALDGYLKLHPAINRNRLSIWIVSLNDEDRASVSFY